MWLEGRSAPLTADAVVLPDAEIRDTATGRFIDRDKLHYVHFEGAHFRVRGPAIVPRPPQGHPVVAIDATDPVTWQTAARHADVALVRATGPDAAGRIRDELRHRAVAYGRDADALTVLAAIAVDLGDGECAAELGPERGPLTAVADGPPLYRGGTGRPRRADRRLAGRTGGGRLPHRPRRTPP